MATEMEIVGVQITGLQKGTSLGVSFLQNITKTDELVNVSLKQCGLTLQGVRQGWTPLRALFLPRFKVWGWPQSFNTSDFSDRLRQSKLLAGRRLHPVWCLLGFLGLQSRCITASHWPLLPLLPRKHWLLQGSISGSIHCKCQTCREWDLAELDCLVFAQAEREPFARRCLVFGTAG